MKFSTYILPACIALLSSAQELKTVQAETLPTSAIHRKATSTAKAHPEVLEETASTSTIAKGPAQTSSKSSPSSSPPSPAKNNLKDDPYTRCATQPDANQRTLLDRVPSQRNYTYKAERQIDVYIHVVTTESKRDTYTESMIEDQLTVMNDAYSSMGFTFNLAGSDFTVQDDWAAASAGGDEESQMKEALHMGSYADLNLYFLSDLGDGLLGFCYFPTESPSRQTRVLDGCINLAASLPGAEATNYNMGLTAVHEVGHWFGLYHVFDGNSCTGSGDFVSDTPVQSQATFGCPSKQDSCPDQPGDDSIHNYMDYSYDQCLYEFSDGQAQRARALYDEYRAGN
ncbi:unnamed protein product [Cercospora beticola]|nr:unnamed protein product [Cercospora beticola]